MPKPKPIIDIADIADKTRPWTRDSTDTRFFWIRLKKPWKPHSGRDKGFVLREFNPKTGEHQELKFDPDFVLKWQTGRIHQIEEDSFGMNRDGLVVWRFSADSTLFSELGYDEGSPQVEQLERLLMGRNSLGKQAIIVDSNNVPLIY